MLRIGGADRQVFLGKKKSSVDEKELSDRRWKPVVSRVKTSKLVQTLALVFFVAALVLVSRKSVDLISIRQDANRVEIASKIVGKSVSLPTTTDAVVSSQFENPKAPAERVVFMKIRKVGGTTLQSILYRYAEENQLTIVLPSEERSIQDGISGHIFAHHSTYEEYSKNPTVIDPVFIVILRNPLEHATSCFYWTFQEKFYRKHLPEALHYREEKPGQFTTNHLHMLKVFTSQNTSLLQKSEINAWLSHKYQYQWLGESPEEAIKVLKEKEFIVGFMHDFDTFLTVLMHRLRWPLRSMLYVSLNHYKHPEHSDWPPSYTKAMNTTLAPDWDFYGEALGIAQEQKQWVGGSDAVARLTTEFVHTRDLLMSRCDETRDTDYFAKSHYVPSCKKGCGEQQVLSCVLGTFDECLRKHSPDLKEEEVDSRCKEIRRIDRVFRASVGI